MFNLDQAREAISTKPEFTERDKGSYVVFDYNFSDKSTFVGRNGAETEILHNLRGTAFDKETGEIIRLGFHTFFNLGEHPFIDEHYDILSGMITEKLDGSCIFPIYAKEGTVLGTRAGVTDISQMATDFVRSIDKFEKFLLDLREIGATPIFVFCSRKNRVVIDHPIDRLVLLAVRFMDTGAYISYEDLVEGGEIYGIEVVQPVVFTAGNLIDQVRAMEGSEGIVISFDGGHKIKIKADEYVRKHKAVDQLKFEKDVALLFINNEIDDILPILDTHMAVRVNHFCGAFLDAYTRTSNQMVEMFSALMYTTEDRKSFAMAVRSSKFKSFMFQMLDSKEMNMQLCAYGILNEWIKSKCNTQKNYEEVRKMLDMTHTY